MDDIVKQAMAKWPNVPDCYGWLGLDARGNWCMRDDAVQACGAFASGLPGAKGSVLRHDKLVAFIGRNYACNDRGEWFFQNGPQQPRGCGGCRVIFRCRPIPASPPTAPCV